MCKFSIDKWLVFFPQSPIPLSMSILSSSQLLSHTNLSPAVFCLLLIDDVRLEVHLHKLNHMMWEKTKHIKYLAYCLPSYLNRLIGDIICCCHHVVVSSWISWLQSFIKNISAVQSKKCPRSVFVSVTLKVTCYFTALPTEKSNSL